MLDNALYELAYFLHSSLFPNLERETGLQILQHACANIYGCTLALLCRLVLYDLLVGQVSSPKMDASLDYFARLVLICLQPSV